MNSVFKCDKQFSDKSGLKKHIQSIHEQVKYTCTECNKQFSEKSSTPSDGIDLRNVVFKQSPREGHQFKYETENSNHELNTRDTFERIDTVLDSNSRDAFTTTTNKTDLETAIVRQDAVFSVK